MGKEDQQNITSETFFNLYQRVFNDEDVVKINDAPGITIVRKYDEKTKCFKDGKRIFVKFYVRDGYIIGSVDMVHKNEDGTFSSFDSTKPYKNPFTNFFFDEKEGIIFNAEENKFFIKRKKFNVNDFVDLLIKNHLADRLFWRRKLNKLKIYFLFFIFWSIDQKYDWIDYYHKVHDKNRKFPLNVTDTVNIELPDACEIDPFFRYFKIYRKILFCCIVVTTLILFYTFNKVNYRIDYINSFYVLFKVENFTITNPILLFSFFIFLSSLHYLSAYLKAIIYDKDRFIYKLHISSLNNSFSLNLNI